MWVSPSHDILLGSVGKVQGCACGERGSGAERNDPMRSGHATADLMVGEMIVFPGGTVAAVGLVLV